MLQSYFWLAYMDFLVQYAIVRQQTSLKVENLVVELCKFQVGLLFLILLVDDGMRRLIK